MACQLPNHSVLGDDSDRYRATQSGGGAGTAGGVGDRFGRYDQQIDQVMKEGYKSVEQSASQYGITVDLQHEIDEFRPTGHTEGLAVKLLRCW